MLLRAAAALCALLHLAAALYEQQATTLQSLRASATNFDTATAAAPGRPWDPSAAGPCPPPGAANNDTWKGVTCDADGIVVSLSLAGLGLQGPLPPALAQLGTLRLLNLSGNAFTGSLPAAWLAPDAFANLTSADLHSNRLGAALPDTLLSLASEIILLGSNLLNGTLPGNWQSSTLRVLGLGNNSLTGQLPNGWAMQGRLPALRELSLQANQLQGSVPAQYWTDGSFLPGLALAAEPGNPAVCGPVPPLSPELLGYNATQLTAANVMYTGNTTTTLTVSAKDLFRPGASVTVTNWLGSCTQPCTAETLPAAVRQQGASWPPSTATNIYDLSRNYSISIADILLSNPGAAAGRPDGAPLQLPCYAPLSAGAQGNYRGGNVAFGMFAGGNQAEGPEGLQGAAAAGRVVGTLPNQYNTSSFYTGSLGPASNGTAGVSQLLEPVWWFVDLLVPFQVSTVVVTAGDGQELRNASLYIGSSPSSVFDNTLVAERFSVAAGKQLALAASGTAGRYVVLYTGTQQEGSMSLADVQVYTAETNAAAAKNVSLRHISTSTYQDVAPQGTPAQDLLALTDNNGTTCVSLPLSPNSSWLAAALVDLGYQAPVGSVALAVGSQLPPGTTARFFVIANRGDRLQPGSPGECASEALALGYPVGWQAQECNQTGRWVAVTLSTPPSNSSDQAATVQLCEVQVSLTQSPSSEVPGSTSDSNSSSGLSAGAIAGIALGAAAGLCLLLLLAAYLRWRHRFRGQVPEQQQEAEAAAAKGDVEMSIGDGKAFSSHSPGADRGGGASAAVLASSDAMGDAAGSSINGGSGRLSEGMAAAAAAATSAARLAGRGQSAARQELQLMDEFVRQLVGRSTSTPLPSPAHSSGSGVPPTAAYPDEQLLGSSGRRGTDLSKLPPGFFDVKFDELQLQQQLGEGSFGKVFLATYCGTLVAVKLIEQPSGTDASGTVLPSNTVRELAKEALLMSKLRHPNVCLYLGACLEPPCLVLEYCAKKSLFALLTAGRSDPRVAKQLGWGRLLGMALDAATGMLYLHTRNPPLAHRDLKSANLLVDSHWRAKVADFNLSGAARDIGAASCSTILMNNPRWMPPEVLGGGEQGHLSADVWAFGTVLWEVMTWRLPFEGMNVFSIIALVQSKGADALAVPPPDELPAGRCACYAEYTALMRDCWAHDPSLRPGFASIVDRLRAMAASQAASGPEKPKPVAAAALVPSAVPTGPPAAAPQAWRAVSVAPPSPSDAASPYDGFVAMMRHPEQQTPFAAAQVDAQLDIMERQPGSIGPPAS